MHKAFHISWRRAIAFSFTALLPVMLIGSIATVQAQDTKNNRLNLSDFRTRQNKTKSVNNVDNTIRSASPDTVFTNPAAIVLDDSGPALLYPSNITVSGLTGTVTDVNVTMNGFSHTFPDDVALLLVSPDGRKFILESDVGGGTDVSNVTYTFDDQATAIIGNSGPFPANGTSVRPSSVGDDDEMDPPAPPYPYDQPAPAGSATLNGTFGGAAPNGVWQLFVYDFFAGDSGMYDGGWSIDITTTGGSGGTLQKPPVDFNGDGKSDYAVVRNTGGGSGGQITWYILPNGGGAPSGIEWGISTDFFVPEDYDGDSKTDVAVWRPTGLGDPTKAYFFVIASATNTFQSAQFGAQGDNPTVVRDYDGDGKADFAVYRGGAAAGNPSYWFYRPSGTPATDFTSVQWGQNGDFPAPGDYDGDGKGDFVVQRSAGGSSAVFLMNKSGGGTEQVYWGLPTDFIVPGDYDGDGKTDVAVSRTISGQINWFIQLRAGGTQSYIFGQTGDVRVQGEYTGDGKTDVAVWRPSNGGFYVRPSGTTGASDIAVQWGANGDYPVANYNVH